MLTHRRAADTLGDPIAALRGPLRALDATAARARGAALLTGVAAGVAFVALEALATRLLVGAGPRSALRELVAAAMAGDASAGVLVVALAGVSTIVIALAYGALVAVAARRCARRAPWWSGAASGITVYAVNFYYLLAPALRWVGEVRDQVSVLSPWYLVSMWP